MMSLSSLANIVRKIGKKAIMTSKRNGEQIEYDISNTAPGFEATYFVDSFISKNIK